MNIYVSGDNGVGKTLISAGIAMVMQSLGYNTGVYKPIQTNALDKEEFLVSLDLAFVKMMDPYITTHSTYMLKSKTVPVIGAELQNVNIEKETIVKDYTILSKKTDILLTESTGGLMTPLKDNMFSFNIPLFLNLPVVFVINPSTNSINHYLNELNNAKTLGLDILGVIINKFPANSDDMEIKSFPALIESYSDVKVLGLIRSLNGNSINVNTLISEIMNGIDLEDVFKMKIPKLNG